MPTVIDGNLGVDVVQDGAISTAKLAAGAVTPAKTQMGALPSMIRVNTSNGYGSTGTKARRFLNVTSGVNGCVIQGTDITFSNDATTGNTFTINTNGVYAISYNDEFNTTSWVGISLNATSAATGVTSLVAAERLALAFTGSSTASAFSGFCGYFAAGSVIRAHTDGASTGGSLERVNFCIVRIA